MTNPAEHSTLILGTSLRRPVFALALICALTMFAMQPAAAVAASSGDHAVS